MNALRALVLGIGALAAAATVGALAPPLPGDATVASLGGLSTIYVDTLFLRAESLRREGRFDEIPAVYRRILGADPASEAAVDTLADTLGNDLRTLATTPEGRAARWQEADDLLARALERRPLASRLAFRRAHLRLGPAAADAAVAQALARRGGDPSLEGLRFLADAVERTPSLGRAGRAHLVLFATAVPRLAAERFAAGDDRGVDEILARGDAALRTRSAELSDFTLDDGGSALSAADRLYGGLGLVRTVRELLARRPPELVRARALVAAYRTGVGDDATVRAVAERIR